MDYYPAATAGPRDDAQEVPSEDSAWGVVRWHDLRDEEPWPTLEECCQDLEQLLEEERGLIGDILIEEGAQRIEKNHQPDRRGSKGSRRSQSSMGNCQQVKARTRWIRRTKMSGAIRQVLATIGVT
jgi:hypothetical protein